MQLTTPQQAPQLEDKALRTWLQQLRNDLNLMKSIIEQLQKDVEQIKKA